MGNTLYDEGDGFHTTTLTGTYSLDEDTKVLTIGADGSADTAFIIPSITPWVLTEVYDIEGTAYDIGLTTYNDNLTTMLADLEALRQEALGVYTTFTMIATHYKTGGIGDVYLGNELHQMSVSAPNTDICVKVSGTNWIITRDLTSKRSTAALYPSQSLYPNPFLGIGIDNPPLYPSITLYPSCRLYPSA